MATEIRLRRGTSAQHVGPPGFVGAEGEPTYDSTLQTIRVHDGSTAGGHVLAKLSDMEAGYGSIDSAVTYTIGAGQDYPSYQAAINDLSKRHVSAQGRINLELAAGEVLSEGLLLEDGDYGHFTLSSVSSTVFLPTNPALFTPANASRVLSTLKWCVLGFINCRAPVMNIFIDSGGCASADSSHPFKDSTTGLYGVVWGLQASGIVLPGKGATGFWAGAEIRDATVSARSTVWINSLGWYNLRATSSSMADIASANLSAGGSRGLEVSRGSYVYADGCNMSNCADSGVYIRRSFCSLQNADVLNCAVNGIMFDAGSSGLAINANVSGSGGTGLRIVGGGSCDARGLIANDCAHGIYARTTYVDAGVLAHASRNPTGRTNVSWSGSSPTGRGIDADAGSIIDATSCIATGRLIGLRCQQASVITAENATLDNTAVGISAADNSQIHAKNVSIANSIQPVVSASASIVNVHNLNAPNSGDGLGTDQICGLLASGCATINASGATITNCTGGQAVHARDQSTINVVGAVISGGAFNNIAAYANSSINARGVVIDNTVSPAVIPDAAILPSRGGSVCFHSGTLKGYNVIGLRSSRGAVLDATDAKIQKSAVVEANSTDIGVLYGGIVSASGTTLVDDVMTSCGVSQTANTITAAGIIFR